MSEEVNRLPFDKTTISFYKASLILEDWIQKVEVARKYKAHIEPQKMLVIVTKITEAVRNADGVPDQLFGYEFHQFLRDLRVRDCTTYSNVELLSKQVLGSMRNRLREISTSRVALRTTLSSKDQNRPSALAADAEDRRKLSEMTCKYFLSDDGCKKGKHCEAKHTPAK
eukprot:156923-Amphidinium_carterae.1